MNIILEGGINFYDELHNMDTDDETENCCLLTNLPLDKNRIKLPCNHEFNFLPLYNEVLHQKMKTPTSHLNMDKLAFNQIKCPYCRQKSEFLLPQVRLNKNMIFYPGVNSPEQLCMDFHTCEYIFKSGKNKNNYCSKTAYYDAAGCFCPAHHITMDKKNKKTSSSSKPTIISNNENIVLCNVILKYGKRMGQECGSKTCTDNTQFCKRHLPK